MIIKIKDKLRNNEDLIREILEDLECKNIHKISQDEFRFGRDEEGN